MLNSNQTFKNGNIPNDVKNEIVKLDQKVIKAIKNNDVNLLKDVFSEKLMEKIDQSKNDSIFNFINEVLKDKEFKYKDQLYVINTTKNVSNTIFSGLTDDYDYIINYQALNKEMFISMLLPKDTEDELLITLIYGLYGNDWKLNIFQFGQYSIFGKTAIDYYIDAKGDYENKYLTDAANNILLGQQCLKPANQFMQYQKEKDFIELRKKIMEEINATYQFPLKVEQISTKPQIFNIHPQETTEGNFPMISYYTKINLNDTIRLKKENLEIQKVIGDIFKGIDQNKKYVFYKAFDELPDGTIKERHSYGFVQEIEKK
jgi:hypothetical protein